ncbi:MAG: TIM barrel protein [Acidobacteria bacterium]|nr:TIM barrel protein [Acidobacteriota bacterium]
MGSAASRREFLVGVAAVGWSAAFADVRAQNALPPKSPIGIGGAAMGALNRGVPGVFEGLRGNPVRYIEYCRMMGAGGIQAGFTTQLPEIRRKLDELGMYYEGNAALPNTIDGDTAPFEQSILAAKELGATCVRAVSRSLPGGTGRRYETYTSLAQYQEWERTANAIVERVLPIAEKHRIAIALENHKDRAAEDHAAFLKRVSSEWLGSLIDPGNNMSFMEDAEHTVTLLAPYVKAVSLKDMGVAPSEDGFLLSEVVFGTGCTDQKALFEIARKHNPRIQATEELITRDPLRVPVLTDDYYRSFPAPMRARRDSWMAMVREKQTKLPVVSGLSPAELLKTEEDNHRATIAWGLKNLTFPRA